MTAQLVNLYAQEFSTTAQLLVQQKGSRFRNAITIGTHRGTQASPVDQYGSAAASKRTGRYQPLASSEVPTDRRWVTPQIYDLPLLIDNFEKLRMISDPMSAEQMAVNAAMGRSIDDEFVGNIFGTSLTGVSGGTSTTFPSGQQGSVSSGGTTSNINVEKLRLARANFRTNEVDLDNEEMYCAISGSQEAALLREIEITNLDYNDRPVLVDGKVSRFLGINFIHSERLATNGSGYRRCPVWVKSGIHLGIWEDIGVDISQRKDLSSLPWQIYAKMMIGVTRLEEKKVFEIVCNES